MRPKQEETWKWRKREFQ